jgi:hypothetical protein
VAAAGALASPNLQAALSIHAATAQAVSHPVCPCCQRLLHTAMLNNLFVNVCMAELGPLLAFTHASIRNLIHLGMCSCGMQMALLSWPTGGGLTRMQQLLRAYPMSA